MKPQRILLGLVTIIFSISLIYAGSRDNKKDVARNLEIFAATYKVLNSTYVDSVDSEKAIRAAIDAMLNEFDPYTVYIPEEEQEDFLTISTGEFGGIGAYIGQNSAGETFVSEPQEGTPAFMSGIKAGDVFVTIDGDTVTALGSEKVRERLRGQAGTSLTVTVRRPLTQERDTTLSINLTRAKIEIATVPYYGVVRDSIGYIALTTFNEKAYSLVKKALIELRNDPRTKGIVLDLRGNGGGLLEEAVSIVSLFVPKGTEVLRTRGRNLTNEKIYKTTSKPVDTDIPLAVLIDASTASSAEIVSGALQDLDRAVILGNRSYGKGLVQSTRTVPHDGLVKVTTARYYIPSGRLIQAIDYSHRNPDGSVARTPDSLTNVFYTRAKRVVRDGGGITPDITITYPEFNRLTYNLVSGNHVFDFATIYAATHDSIATPETFEVDDELYAAFKASLDPEKVQYDKVCEVFIDELEKTVEKEGYLNDEVAKQIATLREMLRHDFNKDLDTNREQISSYLATELLSRYYHNRGSYAYTARTDIAVDRAIEILCNPSEYKQLLSPQPEAK